MVASANTAATMPLTLKGNLAMVESGNQVEKKQIFLLAGRLSLCQV